MNTPKRALNRISPNPALPEVRRGHPHLWNSKQMTPRETWEMAAEHALTQGNGYAQLEGNMLARLDQMFPLNERRFCTYEERTMAFLFMACLEDDSCDD
jgi:phage portal protein BeeE